MGVLGAEFSWLEQGIVDTLYAPPSPVPGLEPVPPAKPAETRQLAGVAS